MGIAIGCGGGAAVLATRQAMRALALVIILALIPLHWLLFQGQEVVPGVITRPLGSCDVEWFEKCDGSGRGGSFDFNVLSSA
jgi:hypothetical protein